MSQGDIRIKACGLPKAFVIHQKIQHQKSIVGVLGNLDVSTLSKGLNHISNRKKSDRYNKINSS